MQAIHTLLCRAGLRFPEAELEKQYHAWRINTGTPFARIGYIGSLPSWALLLLAIYLIDPANFHVAAPLIIGLIILLIFSLLLTQWEKALSTTMPLAALCNCIAGFIVVWLLYKGVGTQLDVGVNAGIMTGGLLIVMYFGFAIFRIPPLLATLAITPYVGFSLSYLYRDYSTGDLGWVEASAFTACQLIAYGGGLMVCTIIEGTNRHSFTKDQVILSQQKELEKSRDAIRRYVPPSVAERIIKGETDSISEPNRKQITVLFSDIVGFTHMAEQTRPELMTRIINEYMEAMAGIVDQYDGTLTEFMGDGLMVMFGAPQALPTETQVLNAVKSAMEMRYRLPDLNQSWVAQGMAEELKIRIGINCGSASVGSFGSKGRMTYTAIGLQVNIAERIQLHCEPNGILLSDAAHGLIKDQVQCELVGMVACKGVEAPIKVYSPNDLTNAEVAHV